MNLKYMKVSLFEISYKKKLTFSRHSNLLRCTCIWDLYISSSKIPDSRFKFQLQFCILNLNWIQISSQSTYEWHTTLPLTHTFSFTMRLSHTHAAVYEPPLPPPAGFSWMDAEAQGPAASTLRLWLRKGGMLEELVASVAITCAASLKHPASHSM